MFPNTQMMSSSEEISNIMGSIKKKRPKMTKLDIEKLFQQSIQLTEVHKKLMKENAILRDQYQKVEANKANRQKFISSVQQIVKQKIEDVSMKNNQKTSWLVLNLKKKIYDLKNKIEQKDNIIQNLQLNKENQQIKKKQIQLQCFEQILSFAKQENLYQDSEENISYGQDQVIEEKNSLKEIFWIENYLDQQKRKLIELQIAYQYQQRENKKIMKELAAKKAELKNIKQMESQYNRAQEHYQEQKKRKQQTLAGKKNYISDLLKIKEEETKKLQELQEKYKIIEQEESQQIRKLEQDLKMLQNIYHEAQI